MSNPIWEVIRFKDKGADETIYNILKEVPIFSELKKRELDEVAKIIHRRSYKIDEKIFSMGDPGLGMYIIIEGTIAILGEKDNQTHHIVDLEDGAFFGDLALLDESPRSATAVAIGPCDILGFFRPDLMDLLYRKPRIGIKIVLSLARVIGERLRRTNKQMAELQKKLEEVDNG